MRRRDFIQMLGEAGWTLLREGGEHTLYTKNGRNFAVPRHREISDGIVRSWRRENGRADEEESSQ